MALTDEARREREKVKKLPYKKKVEHYIHYYKKPTILTIFAVLIVASTVYSVVAQKETIFNAVFINSLANNEVNELKIEFDEFLDFDEKKYETFFDTSVVISELVQDEGAVLSQQKLAAMIGIQDVDIIASNVEAFVGLVYGDYFANLNDFFTEEELEFYKDDIFYMDMKMKRELDELLDNIENIDLENYDFEGIDPKKPELMAEPVPVGLTFESNSKLGHEYRFFSDEMAIGILINTKRGDTAVEFINMALQIK